MGLVRGATRADNQGERRKEAATMNAFAIHSVPALRPGFRSQTQRPGLPSVVPFRAAGTGVTEFPPFRLDLVNQCLWRPGNSGGDERIPMQPKPFAILRHLAANAGRLVTQDELLDAVWPDTHVQPEVLKRHVFEIRQVLGDDPKHPLFIETLPRRGYQFMVPTGKEAARHAGHRNGQAGKESTLDKLWPCLRKALGGQRQVVFVGGETDIDEIQRQAGAIAGLHSACGQCVEGYGSREAFYPMLKALGDLCRQPGGDSFVQVLGSHAPTWLAQFPALMTREQRETLRDELRGSTRERMLREICDALETVTATTPLLLILEDLQWADLHTVDLISAIARGRAPGKLMLIGTYRPTDRPGSEQALKSVRQDLLAHRLCGEITLEPRDKTEIAENLIARSAAGGSQ